MYVSTMNKYNHVVINTFIIISESVALDLLLHRGMHELNDFGRDLKNKHFNVFGFKIRFFLAGW